MPRPAGARRDEGAYRQYSIPVRSGPTLAASGCSAARMQRDFHHGLLGPYGAIMPPEVEHAAIALLVGEALDLVGGPVAHAEGM